MKRMLVLIRRHLRQFERAMLESGVSEKVAASVELRFIEVEKRLWEKKRCER